MMPTPTAGRADRRRSASALPTVVVAVPRAWIDVAHHGRPRRRRAPVPARTAAAARRDQYINLTRASSPRHGIVDYRIVESSGATEGAPAAGAAELIVDITTTGATLDANGLKVLADGLILRSQANLWPRGRLTGMTPRARPRA